MNFIFFSKFRPISNLNRLYIGHFCPEDPEQSTINKWGKFQNQTRSLSISTKSKKLQFIQSLTKNWIIHTVINITSITSIGAHLSEHTPGSYTNSQVKRFDISLDNKFQTFRNFGTSQRPSTGPISQKWHYSIEFSLATRGRSLGQIYWGSHVKSQVHNR